MNFDKNSKAIKIGGIVLILFLLYLVIHHFTKSKGPTIPAPVVMIQSPVLKEMTEYVTQTGTTVAVNSVNLVARVEGYLDSIQFKDGTYVKKDTELFVIQPEPYMEQLKAAQATVTGQKAALAYNKAEYRRQQRMFKENATSLNNVEIWLAKTQEAEAALAKAIADEQIAAINYSYTHISAPFDGRMGRHLIDVGNLVGHGEATELATIEKTDSLYVYFNLNEIDLIRLRAAARANNIKPSDIYKITVGINLQNETGYKYKATLDFVNTGLNAATGTMELRALLENKDHIFVPGLFVQVRVPLGKPQKQVTVPDSALLYDQIGAYLLTVNSNDEVELKRVVPGSVEQGIRAITKGLTLQDKVIVGGLQNASPGHKVSPQQQKEPAV